MSAEGRALAEMLATSIADGTPIDWRHAEQAAAPDELRVIRRLRLVSNVAELYRSLPPEPGHGEAPAPQPQGERWGHLVLLAPIGRGTSGEVHRAFDLELQREVALKLFPRDPSGGSRAHAEVLAEARRLARVRHPNVAAVYGADRDQDRVGFWMELVAGASLQDLLDRDGVFGARETASIGIELCAALAAVHGAGLLHRDVKAQNVLRETGGRIVLTDFGTGEDVGTTFTRMAGTPVYLAPEILAGKPASIQSDLYSLGVLLFYLVAREFPVQARTMPDLMRAHKAGTVRHLRDLRPDLPVAFVEVVERLLAGDPAARFQSAGAVEAALRRALEPAPPAVVGPATPAAGRGTRRYVAAAALLLLVVLGGIIWSIWPSAPISATQRIAVAPMRPIDGGAPPFFAEGLTDQLISTLGQIKSLQVRSAESDDGSIAGRGDADVDAVLETTVATVAGEDGSPGRIRVNARLLQAGTGTVRWSDSFEHELGDAFSLQGALARKIAAAINAVTTPDEDARLGQARRTTPEAEAAFLEGVAHVENYGIEDWRRAQAAFERAIVADPEHAQAHAGLARAVFTLGHADAMPASKARALALAEAERALELDDTLPEAHATLADIAFYYDWNWQEAEKRYIRSLESNPSFMYGRTQYAQMLAASRRTAEAVGEAMTAVDLQSSSARAYRWLAMMRYYHRDFAGASAAIERSLEFERHAPGAWILLGRIAEAEGRIEEARAHTDWAVKLSGGAPALLRVQQLRLMAIAGQATEARASLEAIRADFDDRGIPWNPQFDAYILLALGEHERALDFFETALNQRHWSLLWLAVDPRLDPVRDHPRFEALLRGLGTP